MKWFKRKEKPVIVPAPCEVCGYLTMDANMRNLFEICPVCFWEDDEFHEDPNEPCGGANHQLTLAQAKANYKKFGACSEDLAQYTRKPTPEEIPSPHTLSISAKDQKEFDELKAQLETAKANMPNDIREAHTHSSEHREEILASTSCGCFYCMAIFPPTVIKEWVDDDKCALCPECEIDSVIGDKSGYPITQRFLNIMHRYWFD